MTTFTTLLIFILLVQVIHFLGTWKLYVKAGRKSWESLVPIYNGIVLMKILKRPSWWIILLFIPMRLDQKRIDPLEVILINKAIINDRAIIITTIINAEKTSKRRFISTSSDLGIYQFLCVQNQVSCN